MSVAFQGEASDAFVGAPRPGFGTVGRKIPIYSNAFEVSAPLIVCHHYAVRITPDVPTLPPKLCRDIWRYLDVTSNIFGGIAVAFDGRAMAYSPTKLPADEGTFIIDLPEEDGSTRSRQFTVHIHYTRPIDLGRLTVFVNGTGSQMPDVSEIQSAVQALNICIQHGPSMLYPNQKASFFLPPENPQAASLAKGLELWRGFYSSLRPGPRKLFVNLDIASQPMYKSGNLPDVILAYLRANTRNITPAEMAADRIPSRAALEVDRFLRGVKVTLKVRSPDGTSPQRKIKGFEAKVSAATAMFALDDGGQISVADYFSRNYGITLNRPDFPLVRVSKTALWPIELCSIEPGQKFSGKLDPDQTADAIKLTTVAPRQRVDLLKAGMARIQPETLTTTGQTALGQWGVKIAADPMQIIARELPAPTVSYGKRSLQPREGVWDHKGQQFFAPSVIDSWLVLVFDSERFFGIKEAQSATLGLISACSSAGITITDERPPIHYVPRGVDIPSFILGKGAELVASTGQPPKLVVCFLSRKPCDEYAIIKRFGDCAQGVATQCLFVNKAKKGNPAYFNNLSLKINVKLGGINSVLDQPSLGPVAEMPTMIFGADVTHPAPGSLAPSIASIVGSMDAKVSLYGTSIRIQSSRVELISHLEQSVAKLISQFEKRLQVKPARLIFFRDGVSEGQFAAALAIEVAAIRLACKLLDPSYSPALTYIACGKRHHNSFFPRNEADGDRKNGNVKAGTTVDSDITSPFQFDWYSQSHASLLGTGRSCHYTVLVDDSGFSADTLQPLVYNLCFTYARCTRSVSYATPAFYASRVCTRAQLLLKRDSEDDHSTIISSHSGSSEEKIRAAHLVDYESRLKTIHENHATSLYFM